MEAIVRRFKIPNRDQLMLFPPNLNDWVGPNHPARYVVDFVENLDFTAFYAEYGDGPEGQPPYDPRMMLAVLLYANMLGITSSRKIERMLNDDLGFRFIVSDLRPDHDTIAAFRDRHRTNLQEVFAASVRLAMKANIVQLNHVAIDGTKMSANAAQQAKKQKNELDEEIRLIKSSIGNYLEEAAAVDKAEDEEFGKGRNGYLLPDFLQDENARKQWIKEELAKLKDEASTAPGKEEEEEEQQQPPRTLTKSEKKLIKKMGKLEKARQALEDKERKRKEEDPTGKRQRDNERKSGKPYVPKINVTDVDARTMMFNDARYREGYNCQIAVDADCGIIVAASVTQDANDLRQLEPMVLQVEKNAGWRPSNVSADTGYFNVQHMEKLKNTEFYIPPRKRAPKEAPTSKAEHMREKLEGSLGRAIYSMRKTIVEPVFGMVKHARGFRQFSLRGKEKVSAEWNLICTSHNLMKMFNQGVAMAP